MAASVAVLLSNKTIQKTNENAGYRNDGTFTDETGDWLEGSEQPVTREA